MKTLHTFVQRGFSLALILTVAACASSKSASKAEEEAQPRRLNVHVSDEPEPLATPGGYWPPKPVVETTTATAEPPAKMLTTDGFQLDEKRNPKAELKQRAIERWALLIASRGADAFDYLSPGYQKSHDKVKYGNDMNSRPVRWFRATLDHIDCKSEASCEATLLVDFRVRMSAGMGVTESFSIVKEQWIATDGVWYHLPTEAGG
jgi:hypothetical protein